MRRQLLILRALLTFVVLDLAFHVLGFDRLLRLILWRRSRTGSWLVADSRQEAQSTFAAVQDATMLYYRRREDCLPKALTTFHLLRRQGIPAELCFAVKKYPFTAHAWVEAYGEPLDDEPSRLKRYTVIHRVAG